MWKALYDATIEAGKKKMRATPPRSGRIPRLLLSPEESARCAAAWR
jgi:hypothetical protein